MVRNNIGVRRYAISCRWSSFVRGFALFDDDIFEWCNYISVFLFWYYYVRSQFIFFSGWFAIKCMFAEMHARSQVQLSKSTSKSGRFLIEFSANLRWRPSSPRRSSDISIGCVHFVWNKYPQFRNWTQKMHKNPVELLQNIREMSYNCYLFQYLQFSNSRS